MGKFKSQQGSSQCQLIGLQIDSFLDGELEALQISAFEAHMEGCAECARQLNYASLVNNAVNTLPEWDCPDHVIDSVQSHIEQLGSPLEGPSGDQLHSGLSPARNLYLALQLYLSSWPAYARYGFPVVLAFAIGFAVNLSPLSSNPNPQMAASELTPTYTPEEMYQAMQDLNLAMDYVRRASLRTEVMVGERFLINPLQDSINASFVGNRRASTDDPI